MNQLDYAVATLRQRAKSLYDSELAYHNWRHVKEVLAAHDAIWTSQFSEAKVAIFFHDCVYVPGADAGVNEDLSALQFKRALRDLRQEEGHKLLDEDLILLMIEGTKVDRHLSETFLLGIRLDYGGEVAQAVGSVMDADLCALAADYNTFVAKQDAIIHEQAGTLVITDLAAARVRSAEFLRQFTSKPSIYHTPRAKATLEALAQANIRRWCKENGVKHD